MRISIPGVPGVYVDTDSQSAAIATALTAAARRAPKPQGYVLQGLPLLWSLEVDLEEVPSDHPFQYLHPEGARSLDSLADDGPVALAGRQADAALRAAWAMNHAVEQGFGSVLGADDRDDDRDDEGVRIPIDDE